MAIEIVERPVDAAPVELGGAPKDLSAVVEASDPSNTAADPSAKPVSQDGSPSPEDTKKAKADWDRRFAALKREEREKRDTFTKKEAEIKAREEKLNRVDAAAKSRDLSAVLETLGIDFDEFLDDYVKGKKEPTADDKLTKLEKELESFKEREARLSKEAEERAKADAESKAIAHHMGLIQAEIEKEPGKYENLTNNNLIKKLSQGTYSNGYELALDVMAAHVQKHNEVPTYAQAAEMAEQFLAADKAEYAQLLGVEQIKRETQQPPKALSNRLAAAAPSVSTGKPVTREERNARMEKYLREHGWGTNA